LSLLWSKLLKNNAIRKALLTHLQSDYFHELNYSIPLGNEYWVHLWENDAYDSFSEIFIQQEYAAYIPKQPLNRILDLGAHYGYFSLWLQSIRPKDQIYSIMVEPSRRCRRSLDKLIEHSQLKPRFKYLQSAISDPCKESTKFFERPFMGGSMFESSNTEDSYQVKSLKISDIVETTGAPLDLVKCDLEGAEWHLLTNYSEILTKSKFLIMEWHSWHTGGGGIVQIEKQLNDLEFNILRSSPPAQAVGREGEVGLFLAQNLNFEN
jgi:FkbM family methyltransferase